jgi:hypothetical protein
MSHIRPIKFDNDKRLPLGQSVIIITLLGALAWALLIWLVVSILQETLG